MQYCRPLHGLVLAFGLLFLALAGCSKTANGTGGAQEAPPPSGAPAGEPAAGEATPSAGGSTSGETATSPDGGTSGEAPPADGDVETLMDCDRSKVRCKRIAPVCPEGEAPSVVGSCYGPCVAIERCACSETVQCPNSDKYLCWGNKHCGPYVR